MIYAQTVDKTETIRIVFRSHEIIRQRYLASNAFGLEFSESRKSCLSHANTCAVCIAHTHTHTGTQTQMHLQDKVNAIKASNINGQSKKQSSNSVGVNSGQATLKRVHLLGLQCY